MTLWSALELDMARHRLVTLVGGGGKTTGIYALAHEARLAGLSVVVTTTTHMLPHPGLFPTEDTDPERLKALLAQYGILAVGTLTQAGKMTGPVDLSPCKAAADLVLVEGDGARCLPLKAPADHEPAIPPQADAVVAVCGMDCLGQAIETVCHRPGRVAALLDKPLSATISPADVAKILLSPQGGRKNVGGLPFRCMLNKADTDPRKAGAGEIAALLAKAGVPAAITSYTEKERGGLCWF